MATTSSESSSYCSDSSSSSSDELENGLTVRYTSTSADEYPRIHAYVLKVEILNAIGYPDHLFVFQRSKENEIGDCVDEFIQVASPLEVEEVPEDAPDLLNHMPYYRTNEVTLYFRCMEDLDLAKENIRNDLKMLTKTYDTINNGYKRQEIEVL